MFCYLYLLGPSNEYPHHMFSWRKKKNLIRIFLLSAAMKNALCADRSENCHFEVQGTL